MADCSKFGMQTELPEFIAKELRKMNACELGADGEHTLRIARQWFSVPIAKFGICRLRRWVILPTPSSNCCFAAIPYHLNSISTNTYS